MIRYVFLPGLLLASPATAQNAGGSFAESEKLETAMAGCFWERKPETAEFLIEKGMVNDPEVAAASKEAFTACTDVYAENAVTNDGQPVIMSPAGFMAKLRDQDPDRPQTLAEELKELGESWDKEGDS